MKILKLIFKNSLRHKLRTTLTILGIAIAVIAFGVLRTVVTAWYIGVEGAQADRLITRQAVSFIFPLPYSYYEKIQRVPGVEKVTFANWFGGVYIDKNQFFARIAIETENFFDVYSEFVVEPDVLSKFKKQRNACILGEAIAEQYGLKPGDNMVLEGDIYPGRWEFEVVGVYKPRRESTDASQMLFHWELVSERMREEMPPRANDVGWYIVKIDDPGNSAQISEQIDTQFRNSPAETKTETESAFQQSFIAASSAIITSMNVISFVIIGIILLVLGNTMIMSARERTREYAVLKTLGFSGKHLFWLIMGESMFISILGGVVGLFLTYPIVATIEQIIPRGMFPVFQIEPVTLILAVSAALIIGVASAIQPIYKALNTKIVEGFRFVG
ncbi:MAG: FtsX-like permease family protein [Ignavibacteriaceae bacterium]